MTEEEHSDSRTEDDYDEGEDAYDDEGTLDEEEMLSPEENYQDELKMLQDDADLSIEQLRQKYCNAATADEEYDDTQSTSVSDNGDDDDDGDDNGENDNNNERQKLEGPDGENDDPHLSEADCVGPSVMSFQKVEKEHGYFSDVDDNEEDADYVPPDQKRGIRQGPMYQATIPEIIASPKFPEEEEEEERETLLWSPHIKIPMKEVEEFLKNCCDKAMQWAAQSSGSIDTCKAGNLNRNFPLKDDEDALKALLNAGYNTNAALASFPFPRANAAIRSVGPNPAKWTEEDCELFERGMEIHGKNFNLIRRLLPHRTIGEVVHFYYIWKKTERHDMFQERTRSTRNEENPNCTDLMGGLMDQMDQAGSGNVSEIPLNTVPANSDEANDGDILGIPSDAFPAKLNEANDGDVPEIPSNAVQANVDEANGVLDITNEIPADVDLIASKEWSWENGEGNTLPHLDSDTIANVLQ